MLQGSGLLGPEGAHQLRVSQFGDRVARHRKGRHPREAVLRLPRLGGEAGKGKFERESRSTRRRPFRNVGIDSLGEGFEDLPRIRSVTRILNVHGTAIGKQPGVDIALEVGGTQHLREAPLSHTFPQLHLKQTVLGCYEALREEKVVLALSVEMSQAPRITENSGCTVKPLNLQGAVSDRKGGSGSVLKILFRSSRRRRITGVAGVRGVCDRQ